MTRPRMVHRCIVVTVNPPHNAQQVTTKSKEAATSAKVHTLNFGKGDAKSTKFKFVKAATTIALEGKKVRGQAHTASERQSVLHLFTTCIESVAGLSPLRPGLIQKRAEAGALDHRRPAQLCCSTAFSSK